MNAEITIYDNNINLSSTVKGGNGMFYSDFKFGTPKIGFSEKTMYNNNIYIHSINIIWGYISVINTIFNNKKNRKLIADISNNISNNTSNISNNNICNNSSYHNTDHWDKLIETLKNKGVIFVNKYINNINEISYDRLIIANNSKKLIPNEVSHLLQPISGLGIIMKVKNMPECFYYSDFVFITPYNINNNMVNITTHLEVGYNKGNYNIERNSDEYNKIVDMLYKNKEIQKLIPVEVINIWRGVRMNTYDMLPFYYIKNNISIITGGSFLGTNTADNHAKWMVEELYNIKSTLPDGYDPTINRLKMIRWRYLMNTIIIILFIGFMVYLSRS